MTNAPARNRDDSAVDVAAPAPGQPVRRSRRGDLERLLAPVRARLMTAMGVQALGTAAGIAPYVCVALLADELLKPSADHRRVWLIVLVAVAALVARFALVGAAAAISHFADNDLTLVLRRDMATRVGRVPLSWIGQRNSGRVKTAVQDEVSAMHTLVAHAANDVVGAALTPVLVLGYLLWQDWRLASITLIPLIAFTLAYARLTSGYGEQVAAYAAARGRLNAAAVEYVRGIAVVKAFGQAHRAHARFLREADAFATAFGAWTRPMLRPFTIATAAVAGPTMLVVILGSGVGFVAAGWAEPLDVVPFVVLGVGLAGPLLNLEQTAASIQLAAAAATTVTDLLAAPVISEPDQPGVPDGSRVEFTDVCFGYDAHARVLDHVSAVLEPGTVTALVGPSGAGKSTLAGLLPRFGDPDSGSVRVGGVDVREMAARELYRQVGFVLQDVGLVRGSVHDNIALARPDATRAEVAAAAAATQIHDRIEALPRGYDSIIGVDAQLSGGERQRVTIARALLADTPVLVLDEATAWADAESEAAIQTALSRLAVGRTLLVIAHRLSTVADADQILVLDAGRVVERGRHDELIAAGGRYAALCAAQQHTPTDREARR